jgi:hypothetical protein
MAHTEADRVKARLQAETHNSVGLVQLTVTGRHV